jgi:hypothetical protein
MADGFPWPFVEEDAEDFVASVEEREARRRDLFAALIPENAPPEWRAWFRAELTRLFDDLG